MENRKSEYLLNLLELYFQLLTKSSEAASSNCRETTLSLTFSDQSLRRSRITVICALSKTRGCTHVI